MSSQVSGMMEITSWDEKPYVEIDDGRKLTKASVTQKVAGELTGEVSSESLMCYATDGSASFVGLRRVVGTLAQRSGSFVLQEDGTFDGQTATVNGFVVPGSGTDDLEGLTGTFSSSSTHSDYPNMPFTFDYDVA